jgi:DHA2 family multidrug resistance protein-like MFS transporter
LSAVATGQTPDRSSAPARAGLVLLALILVAAVANLNLAVANVALPTIGTAFDASQTSLNLIAIGYSLGLAASVLYLGALGDRYGRKMMLVAGTALAIPFSMLAAWAPNEDVLFAARLGGGLSAGMAFPTTLALVTALWSGTARTRSIALWSGIGAATAALGPMFSGLLLRHFWWGSVFLITLPLAVVALVLAVRLVPAHVNEATAPVDNLGGVLSVLLVAALIIGINFAPVPDSGGIVATMIALTVITVIAFVIRERRIASPLYDLRIAARPTFWVAACAGIIVFGSLMGAMFIGQQFLQNVLGYDTFEAGVAILPGAVCMVVVAPRSAKLVAGQGARFTMLTGYAFVLVGFVTMLALWGESSPYWEVGLAYALIGIGVGFAGTPASHSLTGSVPVRRVGMASGTADLQRDLGGAIMQSILGALLASGYTAAATAAVASAPDVSSSVQGQLTKSFAGAEQIAERYPQHANAIISGARAAFLQGDQWAYVAGIVAVLFGAALVALRFPRRDVERAMLARFGEEDDDRVMVVPEATEPRARVEAPNAGARNTPNGRSQ